MATIEQGETTDRAVATVDPYVLAELLELASTLRRKTPDEIAPASILQTRRDFLRESLGTTRDADIAFERIIGGDELQPVNYLERGMVAARAVARIRLGSGGSGTGFLVAPRVLITNNHVLSDAAGAAAATAQFRYELDFADEELAPVDFQLAPDELFFTSRELDYTIVAVGGLSRRDSLPLSDFGYLPLIETTGKVSEGEWLTIIQHPQGKRKAICVRENQFIKRDDDVLWYTTDTEPGSSGSPVFNNDWYVVALHHAGVPEKRNGVIQKNPDGSTKWIGNEGIRVSRIVHTLKQALPRHPLLLPLFAATPASARIAVPPSVPAASALPPGETRMTPGRTLSIPVEIRLQVQSDGSVRPIGLAAPQGAESSGAITPVELEKKAKRAASFDVPFDSNYAKRKGYDPAFLGKGKGQRVDLPVLDAALQAVAAPLLQPVNGNKFVLHYHNYSVVVHKERRLPIYSAANVSFAKRFDMNRPPDVWRRDPRILASHQLENWYYASNQFDRGHLTRREDLEYGDTPEEALASAADTCHWANCAPQHSRFNQNKEIWQGIERYVLEQSIIAGKVHAQVITGPILEDGNPEYRKVKYPLQFWKIVAALDTSDSLFATAYIASQEEVIAQFGIEVTEVPFGAYKTYQTKITEIERLTGLTFTGGGQALSKVDPLERLTVPRRRRRTGTHEATGRMLPDHYYEIAEIEDIQI